MNMKTTFQASCLGLALALAPMAQDAVAPELRVMQGTTLAPLQVPMNRAVVIESDMPFAELSIANPNIADISTLSDRSSRLPPRSA